MHQTSLKHIENWLKVLIISYQTCPNASVIQCIIYYIDRVLQHDDYQPERGTQCLYTAMRKFWCWKITVQDIEQDQLAQLTYSPNKALTVSVK